MGESHHIVADVVMEKRNLHAVFLQGESASVPPEFYLEGGWETSHISQPGRKTFSAELLAVEIVVGVDDHRDSEGISFSDYISEDLEICIVVFMSFGLESLPSHVESDGVESPPLQVHEVLHHKRPIAIEFIS